MDLPVPAELSGAFAPGVPAVDAFSVVRWRRLLEQNGDAARPMIWPMVKPTVNRLCGWRC